MCARMTLTRPELVEVAAELQAELDVAAPWKARYNVAPTDLHPVLHTDGDRRVLSLWRWGLLGASAAPGERRRGILVNARSETAAYRPSFRDSWRARRCVIPADGFFEWRKTPEGRKPLWFHRGDGRLLLFAGLWEESGQGEPRFVVLTTSPNSLVSSIHDRMPAILSEEEAALWLVKPGETLLHPAPDGVLEATPVSTRVNSVKHDDAACLAPDGSGPRQLELGLF